MLHGTLSPHEEPFFIGVAFGSGCNHVGTGLGHNLASIFQTSRFACVKPLKALVVIRANTCTEQLINLGFSRLAHLPQWGSCGCVFAPPGLCVGASRSNLNQHVLNDDFSREEKLRVHQTEQRMYIYLPLAQLVPEPRLPVCSALILSFCALILPKC